jgi:hypothetical protein
MTLRLASTQRVEVYLQLARVGTGPALTNELEKRLKPPGFTGPGGL